MNTFFAFFLGWVSATLFLTFIIGLWERKHRGGANEQGQSNG